MTVLPPFSRTPFLAYIPEDLSDLPENLINSLSIIAPFLISCQTLHKTLSKLPLNADYYVYDPKGQLSAEEASNVLGNGASKLVTSNGDLVNFIPPERLIISVPQSGIKEETLTNSKLWGVMISNLDVENMNLVELLRKRAQYQDLFIFPSFEDKDLDDTSILLDVASSWSKSNATPAISVLPVSVLRPPVALDLFLSCVKMNSNWENCPPLVPTIPTSITGSALGLVYSSSESIGRTIFDDSSLVTYYSRSRKALWTKGMTSGAVQEILRIRLDCDGDALQFVVRQTKGGFCHIPEQQSCFGDMGSLDHLEQVIKQRKEEATTGSYTRRLFDEPELLKAKIMEEAQELCEAKTEQEVAEECADLLYFALTKCVASGVGLEEISKVLEKRKGKVARRKGDAKKVWAEKFGLSQEQATGVVGGLPTLSSLKSNEKPSTKSTNELTDVIRPRIYALKDQSPSARTDLTKRPTASFATMLTKVNPIIETVQERKDSGLRSLVFKFDRCVPAENSDFSLVINSPFDPSLMQIPEETKQAINVAYENIHKFHSGQLNQDSVLKVETFPGVVCTRFNRPIERVGLYVPGGTAILPSTALMLAIPAQVAGCKQISIATPPREDGSISPEIVYIANLCGVHQIVKAGGAQAVAALAWGTESVKKVDKIFGPGNQWVTAAKMAVSMDSEAGVSIEMPAGPSEVLVIADETCVPSFVAADLLSQAEHGIDSQVVLLPISLSDEKLCEILDQVDAQAKALPRVDIIRKCIVNSLVVKCSNVQEAFDFSNDYAPEHLILHIQDANKSLNKVQNAGSVFVGPWSPESCGDYASGTNHTLPTAGYARQYSGVSTSSFMKHITSQELTREGLKGLGPFVEILAECESLHAHKNAVTVRLKEINKVL